jgi:hypothetical protein
MSRVSGTLFTLALEAIDECNIHQFWEFVKCLECLDATEQVKALKRIWYYSDD